MLLRTSSKCLPDAASQETKAGRQAEGQEHMERTLNRMVLCQDFTDDVTLRSGS